MRGALRPDGALVFVVLLAMALAAPVGSGVVSPPALPAAPGEASGLLPGPDPSALLDVAPLDLEAPTECLLDMECARALAWIQWTERVPIAELATTLTGQAASLAPRPLSLPLPTAFDDYAELPEPLQREAWRAWYIVAAMQAAAPGLSPSPPMRGMEFFEIGGGSASDTPPEELGAPRGLSPVWRLDAHGSPWDMIPAGPSGAYYLVTSRGVMLFPAADEEPTWMVRPRSGISYVETAQGTGETLDLVVGTWGRSFFGSDATIMVIDGETGEVRYRGFGGEDRFYFWTLSDVDGDGVDDIMGITWDFEVMAAKLDGTLIYREALPEQDPPQVSSPFLPLFLGLTHYNDWWGNLFADVNGDGTKDFVVPGEYWAGVYALVIEEWFQMSSVIAYSGRDLGVLWEQTSLPYQGWAWAWPVAAGDVTGDGNDDVLLMEWRFETGPAWQAYSLGTVLLAGADGAELVRDESRFACYLVYCTDAELPYWPIMLIDLTGDGKKEILGAFEDYASMSIELTIRKPSSGGGASEEIARHALTFDDDWYFDVSLVVGPAPEGGEEMLISMPRFNHQEGTASGELLRLSKAGLERKETPGIMLLITREPVSGTLFGWEVKSDRWGALDDALGLAGEGMDLVISLFPVLWDDQNKDGTPDILIRRSLGYRWIDGRTGAILADFDRPLTRYAYSAFENAGQKVLLEYDARDWWEHDNEGLYLIDLKGAEVWSLKPEDREPGWLRGLWDLTGDNHLELAMQEPGEMHQTPDGYEWRPGDLYVVVMPGANRVWTQSTEDRSIIFFDAMTNRRGIEIIISERSEDRSYSMLSLMVLGEESPRWTIEVGSFMGGGLGTLIIIPRDHEGKSYHLVDGATGAIMHEERLPESDDDNVTHQFGSRLLMDLNNNGKAELVQMIRTTTGEGEPVQQRLRLVDWTRNRTLAEFPLFDAPVMTHTVELHGETYTWYSTQYTYVGGLVGDWDRDNLRDLAFIEQGWPTVRSSKTGEILALGPAPANFYPIVDLNNDGRMEVGVNAGMRLRMFTYSAGAEVELDESVEFLRNPAKAGAQEDGAEGLFKTPGPGVFAVLAVLAGLGAFLRRRRD